MLIRPNNSKSMKAHHAGGEHHLAQEIVTLVEKTESEFSAAEVQRFSFGFQIAYPPTAQANTTWPAKSSPRPPSKKFSSSPLLSSAHFQNLKNPFHFSPPTIAQQKYFLRQFMLLITTVVPCCYPRHNSKLPVCPPQNLSPPRVIVIQRTFCRIAPILCPSRVVIPCILLFRAQICSYSQHNALVIPHIFRLLSAAQLYLISK